MKEGLMDYEAVAAYLSISERQVRDLWEKRKLSAVKLGRNVRFSQQDLDKYIELNRVEAAT